MRSQSSDEQTSDDNDQSTSSQDSQQDNGDQDRDDNGRNDDDEDIDDFVVQDDGAVIPELPMAFSRHGHQDMRHDFKIVCQLFVHLAMMPMDERREYMENILKGRSLYTSDVINS
jgi:hypothetical protein